MAIVAAVLLAGYGAACAFWPLSSPELRPPGLALEIAWGGLGHGLGATERVRFLTQRVSWRIMAVTCGELGKLGS